MKRNLLFLLILVFSVPGCGVKGAPMPRRDEVFIEKTLIKSDSEKDEREKDKTTILPKKDVR